MEFYQVLAGDNPRGHDSRPILFPPHDDFGASPTLCRLYTHGQLLPLVADRHIGGAIDGIDHAQSSSLLPSMSSVPNLVNVISPISSSPNRSPHRSLFCLHF